MTSELALPAEALDDDDSQRGQTPSQTLGPFFHPGLVRPAPDGRATIGNVLASEASDGTRIRVRGGVYDGVGKPVSDALLEIWQADAHGRYQHPLDRQNRLRDSAFHGFGRCATDAEGQYWFDTIKPGVVPGPGGSVQAPHIGMIVLARGLLLHLFTRIYFHGDAQHARDPVLACVDAARRDTLIARLSEISAGVAEYVFDVRLQGEHETVFFEV
ncbi:MAG: protocatechuate 3,4-dioxygenase subunit alpha [Polyangiaceae bacterium]